MLFSNLHTISITIFIILLFYWWFILFSLYIKIPEWKIFLNNKLSIIFLFLSFLFILINLFEIKWGVNNDNKDIEWWKIVFVLDVSKSMNAEDIINNWKKISRFETSKLLINSYISEYLNNTYWLIAFAWEALEILPFTSDYWIYKTVLYWVNNWNISKNGTNLNSVFTSLHNYFTTEDEWWLVVIFTDWWDDDINISKEFIFSLKNKWIKILIVWIWTDYWEKIKDWYDLFWRNIYKTYNWKLVITKLNNKVLKNISNKFDLWYISVSTIDDFVDINNYITKNINLVTINKNINYRTDYTRYLIFVSFLFFILHLFINNLIWRKN